MYHCYSNKRHPVNQFKTVDLWINLDDELLLVAVTGQCSALGFLLKKCLLEISLFSFFIFSFSIIFISHNISHPTLCNLKRHLKLCLDDYQKTTERDRGSALLKIQHQEMNTSCSRTKIIQIHAHIYA